MNQPINMPVAVVDGIRQYASQHAVKKDGESIGKLAKEIQDQLRWSNLMGCYSFEYNGMFHGIELDGYVHT